MTYATTNPPALLTPSFDNTPNFPAIWQYQSTDAAATVDTSGYITNGGALGMKVGDLVFANNTSGGIITSHRVISVSATYPGAVDLSDGVTIGTATNTD